MAKRLHYVEQSFLDTVQQNNLISEGDVIVVGVSGGPDSITLLSCLKKYKEKYKCKIVVAHVNHLIRKESTDDEQFVENLCRESNIKFYKKRENIESLSKEKKKSTEEMGRIVRYEFFDEVAKKEGANKIAIAHNMNDNAETMLLNLIRGTGLTGLEGIKPIEYNKYIRPLINCERRYIEDYCYINKLKPRIDTTNNENIYTRNVIRNKVLPILEEINPNIIQSLSRTSKIIAENNEVINNKSKEIFSKIVKNDKEKIIMDLKEFSKVENGIKSKVIQIAIEKVQGNNKNIEKANIDDVIKLAERNIGNKHIYLNKNIRVSILKGKMIFEKIKCC